ncbi:KRAB-A domain-containing protein 2 [Eumeta japonica]|uniref:RNA-directed DNA polymerase n=1 Tax=Eumeta variegata TaxID=151549 RepID=A0A4C1ZDS2_EUMVA|nr:KRAB-A domain-containing protein 2 [Eumeta japonica]
MATINSGVRRNAAEYYWSSRYDVMNIGGSDYLILKRKNHDSPTVRVVPLEEYYDILTDIHKSCGHGGRDKIQYKLKDKFVIVRKAIDLFVSLCPVCQSKRNIPKKGIVTKPILSKDFNERGQVDLIDFQSAPDGQFKWLLNYQDHATKFVHLRPLSSKQASEVALELLKFFLEFGAPYILQSDNGREFTAKIIAEMVNMWPDCKIIHGTPRHPQTQGSVERSNQDVENMLRAWMRDNNSIANWAIGCFFVQYNKNNLFHRILGRSPFRALFLTITDRD